MLLSIPRLDAGAYAQTLRVSSEVLSGVSDSARATAARTVIKALRAGVVEPGDVDRALRQRGNRVFALMAKHAKLPDLPALPRKSLKATKEIRVLSQHVVDGLAHWLRAFHASGDLTADEVTEAVESGADMDLATCAMRGWTRFFDRTCDEAAIPHPKNVYSCYDVLPAPLHRVFACLKDSYSIDGAFSNSDGDVGDGIVVVMNDTPFVGFPTNPARHPALYAEVNRLWDVISAGGHGLTMMESKYAANYVLGSMDEGLSDLEQNVTWEGNEPSYDADALDCLTDCWGWGGPDDIDPDNLREILKFRRAARRATDDADIGKSKPLPKRGPAARLLKGLNAVATAVHATERARVDRVIRDHSDGMAFYASVTPTHSALDDLYEQAMQGHGEDAHAVHLAPKDMKKPSELLAVAKAAIISASAAIAAISYLVEFERAQSPRINRI
ncbi:hypothetical protein RKE25_22470 (plasmid) [Dyella sp. BiH032]|uniref:hypothetical protein n=1 Tax=Dyella sp. BiH032 TaxID=3075430 RepID=UPI00289319D1|nr:hypothetical protein [Dyella sp. BiH032]WNL48498.1 hypothetical protein RKE25_22470 [Dyella sp. BiH032]